MSLYQEDKAYSDYSNESFIDNGEDTISEYNVETEDTSPKMGIAELSALYQSTTQASMQKVKGVSNATSMLQTEEIKEQIAKAVISLEGTVDKGKNKGFFSNMPFVKDFIKKGQDKVRETQIANSSVSDSVEQLFNALSSKRDNVMEVADTLFNLKDGLEENIEQLENQQEFARELSGSLEVLPNSSDQFKARNLLVEVGQSIVDMKSQIGVITNVVQAAQASVQAISSLVPRLQMNAMSGINISAGLQELKELNEVFKKTEEFSNMLSTDNMETTSGLLLDVMDLAIQKGDSKRAVALIESGEKLHANLEKRKGDLLASQVKTIQVLEQGQTTLNNRLEFK